jgi:hypothetical protein
VRPLTYAATSLVVLALAGCGGSDVDVELVWAGPPEAAEAGGVSVDGFASFQGSVDEAWERSPAMATGEFLRLDERTAARTTIDAQAETGEGTGPQTVTVTLDGLADDSVRAERWTLGFEPEDGIYVLAAALRQQRCQPGRGHQDFSAEPCA